jgi:diguanylate cyclase (GGDEF)-like protein
VLLAAVVSAVGLAGWRVDRLWGILAVAIAAWEAADLMYLLAENERLVTLADPLVLTGGLGLAAAVTLAPGRPAGPASNGNRGLFLPVGFGLVALAVLLLAAPLALTVVAVGLAGVALALVLARMAIAFHENRALLDASQLEATTDALTGLGNRRRLALDFARTLHAGPASAPHVLVLLDLNGFKQYNDTYGHGAGDVLLARLGAALAREVDGVGMAYRMGGDEFCVLAPAPADVLAFATWCANALRDQGDGFAISAAYGTAVIPEERHDATQALALADERMYRNKNSTRVPTAQQSVELLLAVPYERAADLAERMLASGTGSHSSDH